MPDIIITEAELRSEYEKLDMMRNRTHEQLLTDEQFKLVSYARSGKSPVTWSKLTQYFKSRGWEKLKLSTLKGRYRKELARRPK